MMNIKSRIEIIPSPRRLLNSLRDLGYDTVSAVADIVDNSIEAKATKIVIDVRIDGRESFICIADNGKGMSPDALQEAMRYGTEREYDSSALGKFGLGMKTASQSQCREFVVASRANVKASICAFAWDMEHVEKTNKWEIIRLAPQDIGGTLCDSIRGATGTVVLWKKLDRVWGYKNPDGAWAERNLLSLCRSLENHLAMVFHRFISGEEGEKRLNIFLNDNKIEPWDPFVRNENHTKRLPSSILKFNDGEMGGQVRMEPFILPHKDKFSSLDAFKRASGPKNWNQQQGFYIYRAGRMIQSGGWSGLRTVDEHTKLARVALHFFPMLDDAFKINVAKMHAELPYQLQGQIKSAVNEAVKIAQKAYRTKESSGKVTPGDQSENLPKRSPIAPLRLWTFDEVASILRSSARDAEITVIDRIIKRARKTFGRKM